MQIIPKTQKEAEELIQRILIQGDCRYTDLYNEINLAKFLLRGIILLEKREIPSITKPTQFDLDLIKGKQREEKHIGRILLKKEGFGNSEISFEQQFYGGQVDILAVSKQKIVAIECCSCRVNKILDYLSGEKGEAEIEVWVLTRGYFLQKNIQLDGMEWFVFKKGNDFSLIFDKWKRARLEEMKLLIKT